MLVEEMKKTRAQASIFSMLEGEDIEGENTNPIPTLNLATSPNSKPRTTPTTKLETNISQPVFMPLPFPKVATTNEQPMSDHSGEKSGDIVPLNFPSIRSLTL